MCPRKDIDVITAKKFTIITEHGSHQAHPRKPGDSAEIDCSFSAPRTLDYAAVRHTDRQDVARSHQVIWNRAGVGQDADGMGAVSGTDAGANSVCGVHGDGE
jgi:hypothetical protein